MSILKVARLGHPVLRARARVIEPGAIESGTIQKLIDDMIETMREYKGVGLAAPQVHEGVRLFVAGIEDAPDDRQPAATVLINPEVVPAGGGEVEDWEGCLSIPDLRGRVPRPADVLVRALDRRGTPVELTLRDYPARVVQHELDHLDGVLFLDRMTSFETLTFLDEFDRFWGSAESG